MTGNMYIDSSSYPEDRKSFHHQEHYPIGNMWGRATRDRNVKEPEIEAYHQKQTMPSLCFLRAMESQRDFVLLRNEMKAMGSSKFLT
jgi:hypothetical protein